MSDNEFASTGQRQEPAERATVSESTKSPVFDQEFDSVIRALHQEFDNVIRTALIDLMNRAATIRAKAEAEADALLKQARDERAQLEAEISSLQQERDRLTQTLNEGLLSLKEGLQELTAILRRAEEQVEQQIQTLQKVGMEAEALKPVIAEELLKPEEEIAEEYKVSEETAPEYWKPKKEAVVGYEVTKEEAIPEPKEPEKETIEEYRMPTEEAFERSVAPEAPQPAVETRLRIIGLRHIGWLHRIEAALADDPFVEDVRTIKYSDGVLVLAVRHQPTSLPGILRRVPGLSVRDVRETGEWIEVYLGETAEIG